MEDFYKELDKLLTNSITAATKRTSIAESVKEFIEAEGGIDKLTPEMQNLINQTMNAKTPAELAEKVSTMTEEQANSISKAAYTKADEIARDPEKKTYFAGTSNALKEYNERKTDQKLFVEIKAAIDEASSDTMRVNGKDIKTGEKEITQAELNKIAAIAEGYGADLRAVNVKGKGDIIQVERNDSFILRSGVTFENDDVSLPDKPSTNEGTPQKPSSGQER